jgi:RNA polymerase sigma factor (sigma-70 family)
VLVKPHQELVLQLLDQHGRSLHRLLARLTRCEQATADLMQDLFIRLSQAEGAADARNLYAYAWKSAVNLAFEWRRRQRAAMGPLDEEAHIDESASPAIGRMIRAEQIERVLAATARLDEPGRSVIIMRYIEQQSYEQIALRLGKDPGYLRALCSKSLAQLRDTCREQEDRRTNHG